MELQKSLPSQLPRLRILDRFMANHKGYVAGGCFKQLFLGEKIKDVDVFFLNSQDAEAAKLHYSANEEYSQIYGNERVTGFKCHKTGVVIEVIASFLDDPERMIGNFDFTVTKAFYAKNDAGEYEFFHHNRFFEHLTNRKLVIDDKILFPLSTFNRSYRYMKYGFGLCGESKKRLIQSLQGVNATNMNDFYFGID